MRLDVLIAIESFRRVFGFPPTPAELEAFPPLRLRPGGSSNALFPLRHRGLLLPSSGPPWPVELSLQGLAHVYPVVGQAPPAFPAGPRMRRTGWALDYLDTAGAEL